MYTFGTYHLITNINREDQLVATLTEGDQSKEI